jgi:hypothetical protein
VHGRQNLTKSRVAQALLQGLTPLGRYGFKIRRKDQALERSRPFGLEQLFFGINHYHPEYVVSFYLGIRVDAVESVFHEFSGTLPAFQSASFTSVTPLSFLPKAELEQRITVSTEAQLADLVKRVVELYTREGEGFFGKYANAAALERALWTEPGFSTIITPFNFMHLLILAKANASSEYGRIRAQALRECAPLNEFDRVKLERLVEYLDSAS